MCMIRNGSIRDAINEGIRRVRFCTDTRTEMGISYAKKGSGLSLYRERNADDDGWTDEWTLTTVGGVTIRFGEEPRCLVDEQGRIFVTTSHSDMNVQVEPDGLTAITYIDKTGDAETLFDGTILTPEEALEKMTALTANDDIETAHMGADDLLIRVLRGLGYGELCDAYERIQKWYA